MNIIMPYDDLLKKIFQLIVLDAVSFKVIQNTCKRFYSLVSDSIKTQTIATTKLTTYEMCACAAASGNFKLLRWIRSCGFEWDPLTCKIAAKHGHFIVLQWARLHGCPWDQSTLEEAIENNHSEIVAWSIKYHCPSTTKIKSKILKRWPHILEYIAIES
jgi:hypothetical protein